MTTTRPSTIKISHITYTVEYLDSQRFLRAEDGKSAMGVSYPSQGIIRVRTSDDYGVFVQSQVKETVLHEIMHCCFAMTSVHHDLKKVKKSQIEEVIVASVSTMLLQVFIDNPDLLHYFLEE